jgi:hypothetical protein
MVVIKQDASHPQLSAGDWGPFTKGERVVYRSGIGGLYSAAVERVHRNGEVTVKVMFPLRDDGTEWNVGYVGTRYRVRPNQNIGGRWRLQ